LSKAIIFKLLKHNNLIDERKIFVAGTIKASNIDDNYYDGRCLAIKNNHLIICRLGGPQKVAPLFSLRKDDIIDISYKKLLFGLEVDLIVKTPSLQEKYNITINKKKVKEIYALFAPF